MTTYNSSNDNISGSSNMILRLLTIALAVLLLAGCTAVAKLERHTVSAYDLGLMYETGYYNPDSPGSSVRQDISIAYGLYLVADRLGDTRAPEKILSLSRRVSVGGKTEIEQKVNNLSIRKLKNSYNVPSEYDRNRLKK